MTEMVETKRPMMTPWKVRVLGGLASLGGIVASVSAGDINDSVGPVINDVVLLFPGLLDLVMGALPIIIALSVVGFLLGLFDGIVSKIKL